MWNAFEIHARGTWNAFEIHARYTWIVCGMCIGCTWNAYEM